jgi:hypothetical protein
MDWLSLRQLAPIDAPDIPLHIAGEVEDDFATRRSTVNTPIERAKVGVRQHAATISIQPISGVVQLWRSLHCNADHFRANVQRYLSFERLGGRDIICDGGGICLVVRGPGCGNGVMPADSFNAPVCSSIRMWLTANMSPSLISLMSMVFIVGMPASLTPSTRRQAHELWR